MSKGIGRLVQIGIAKETVRGTAVTTPAYQIPWSDLSIDESQDQVVKDQSRGILEPNNGMAIVKKYMEGKIKAPIGDKHIGLILLSLFGTDTVSDDPDADASIKDHAFSVAQSSQHQSLTYLLDDPLGAQDYNYPNGMIKQLEINYERGKFIEYGIDVVAQKGATGTTTPATTTENYFTSKHVIFKVATDKSGLTAASPLAVKKMKMMMNQGVVADDVLGSDSPADFLNTEFTVEGEIEAIWQNEADFKTAFLAGTEKAFRLDIKNTDVTIGTAANPQLQIDLGRVTFTALTRAIKLGDLVTQVLKFQAHYSTTDTALVTAKLVNAVASY